MQRVIMSLFSTLNPRASIAVLAVIDAVARVERKRHPGAQRRVAMVLITVAISLLLIHYLKFEASFQAVLSWSVPQGAGADADRTYPGAVVAGLIHRPGIP